MKTKQTTQTTQTTQTDRKAAKDSCNAITNCSSCTNMKDLKCTYWNQTAIKSRWNIEVSPFSTCPKYNQPPAAASTVASEIFEEEK